jgi:SAM-dependent methyltransferase
MTEPPKAMFADGSVYERLMGRWSRIAGRQFIDWLRPSEGLVWLDVGCGNGAFTEEIVGHCAPAAVAGIDPSDGQIDYASKRPGMGVATFQVGDSQDLPYPDQSFDVATMALVIAFVPDLAKGVAELARVIRPGGTAAAYMWDLPAMSLPLGPIYRTLRDMELTAPVPPSADFSTRDAMEGLWRDAGFEDVETTVITITVNFSDFDDFWTSTTLPAGPHAKFVASLPEDARHELRRRLRAGLPTAADGSISYASSANAVKGRRAG